MSKEISKPQKIIMMKSGMPIWGDADRIAKLEEILAAGTGHRFVKIDEKVVNSAEIEGIYTPEQYDEIQKIRQGMWQCNWKKWHNKKDNCDCRAEAMKRKKAEAREKEMAEQSRELTPKEQEIRKENYTKMLERTVLGAGRDSIVRNSFKIGARNVRKMRRSTIKEWESSSGTVDVGDLAIDENA